MITPAQIRQKAERKLTDFLRYKAADFFACLADSDREPFFPLEIKADKGSTAGNLLKRAEELEPLIRESKNKRGRGYSLIFEEVRTRTNGTQSQLKKVLFESEADYLYCTGRKEELVRMLAALDILRRGLERQQELFHWALRNIAALTADHSDESDFWQNICLCVGWFSKNPGSSLYIREIPLPVHTKFIENNEALILGLLFAQDAPGQDAPPARDFEKALGLRQKPVGIRFRSLDKSRLPSIGGLALSEMTVDIADFARLSQSGILSDLERVFIVENEMVYLTFPDVKNAICIWGHGFTVTQLKSCGWLSDYELLYYGDLDEHGLLILSDFRACFPRTKSFCMTEELFDRYSRFAVEGKTLDGGRIPENLTEGELALFRKIRGSVRNRLEQERIPLAEVVMQVAALRP